MEERLMNQIISHRYCEEQNKKISSEYTAWSAMKTRCYNKKRRDYKNYGGRGIRVCDEWLHDFEAFYQYIGARPSSKHSLDRIDNDKNYEPENVRWADLVTQHNNTRRSRCITYKGKSHTLAEWSRILNIKYNTLENRINWQHWTIEKAFNSPLNK